MSNKAILFFADSMTNRLEYTAQLVFEDLLGLNIVFTHDSNDFLVSKLPKINYSQTPLSISKELFIKNQTLLFENTVSKHQIDNDFSHWLTAESPLQFDVLAAIFLLVTRYEEYLIEPSDLDNHQRFSAHLSIAKKYEFLQKPIINQWVISINKHLKLLFPELQTTLSSYRYQPTFDIDMPWQYKNKGFIRTIGGLVKDALNGQFGALKNRINILRGVENDPYFTFDYIFDIHEQNNCPPIFFLLLGDYAEFDKNPDEHNASFRNLIHRISTRFTVGLHPSYKSNTHLSILEKEKARFERLTQMPLHISRQHFLKLRFPETYQRLLTMGITQDYSMGYADDIGFRASIATPFRWFDLAKNEKTSLWIYPFQVMDVTLKDYLQLTPNEAFDKIKQLIVATQTVGGTFITLWHNSSFSDTEGWQNWCNVYEKTVKEAIL